MTLVVGLPRDSRAKAALHLGTMLARSADEDLVVCAVAPLSWPAGLGKVDGEYQSYLADDAERALEAARAVLPADLPVTYEVSRARSAPAGLLETVEKHDAAMLVLGSSASGPVGRVSLGGVADRVLHSSPVPVALAPRGFRLRRPDAGVRRVTAAYSPVGGDDHRADDLVVAAAEVTSRVGATLRLASFAVRLGPTLTAGVGVHAEESVLVEWNREIGRAQRAVLDRVGELPCPPPSETVVGHGADWAEALEDVGWADGDVLVVGSGSGGPLARVFLGSRASKIVRNSPVPVVAVPRRALPESD